MFIHAPCSWYMLKQPHWGKEHARKTFALVFTRFLEIVSVEAKSILLFSLHVRGRAQRL